jgi:predicted amidohydrolase
MRASAEQYEEEDADVPYPTITIGMGQMLVEGGNAPANLARATEMIAAAAAAGCALIVLPECLDVGWMHPSARELAAPIPGPTVDILAKAAAEHGIYVVAGVTERAGEKIYNAAVLLNPAGEILLHHRKINELIFTPELYSIGDRLGVVETPLGVIGIDICADNFNSSLAIGHTLCRMGAHFIFAPCAWVVEMTHDQTANPYGAAWRQSHRQLSYLYGITIASVSNVGPVTGGPWKGRKAIGCSMAFGPDGEALVQGPYGENAEQLLTFRTHAVERNVKGADYAPYLKAKGYSGP